MTTRGPGKGSACLNRRPEPRFRAINDEDAREPGARMAGTIAADAYALAAILRDRRPSEIVTAKP